MKRVQVYLEDEQYARLQNIGNGKEMARHIREAIDIVYPKKGKDSFETILSEVAGIWKDRGDIDISRKGKKRRGYLTSLEIEKK